MKMYVEHTKVSNEASTCPGALVLTSPTEIPRLHESQRGSRAQQRGIWTHSLSPRLTVCRPSALYSLSLCWFPSVISEKHHPRDLSLGSWMLRVESWELRDGNWELGAESRIKANLKLKTSIFIAPTKVYTYWYRLGSDRCVMHVNVAPFHCR